MSFKQPDLPYALGALQPFLHEEQMNYHYNKHQAAYFKNLNAMLEGKPEANSPLKEVIISAEPGGLFNNAAQAWNHDFFWHCMSPDGGGDPKGDVLKAIDRDFEGYDKFKAKFSEAAHAKLFGSGWAWLAIGKDGKLEIMPLKDADTPLKHGKTPLLTLDVWEDAYYIDYRNLRPKFIEGFWTKVNWDFAAKNLDDSTK